MSKIAFIDNNARVIKHKDGTMIPVYRVRVYDMSKKDKQEIERRKKELIEQDYANKLAF